MSETQLVLIVLTQGLATTVKLFQVWGPVSLAYIWGPRTRLLCAVVKSNYILGWFRLMYTSNLCNGIARCYSSAWLCVTCETCVCMYCRDVNETLGPETETFGYLPETRPSKNFPRQDRDLRFRARDETETFRGRDRDVFSRPFSLTVSLYFNNSHIHYTDNMRQLH
jgi:hypothetical protein